YVILWQASTRPADAPRVTSDAKDQQAIANSLRGVSASDGNFIFVLQQGNWYTPFDQPGATRPYDIRGWHAAKK
ncbi:MAG: hypothetical protein HQL38_13540, partial [Alphaproteobacteria bacterium]|nr:hypothetical protein [Alphaproteobacteria bacterium]